MRTYEELLEIAQLSAKQARITLHRDTAQAFWEMAKDYQKRTSNADAGRFHDIGPPPPWMKE